LLTSPLVESLRYFLATLLGLEGQSLKRIGFRIADDRYKRLSEIIDFLRVKGENLTETMRLFIGELHKKLIVDKTSLDELVKT